ncbi:MAG: metal-sensing transcriptional repressor [Candidatus Dojkabacteria bacterium]|nr:MAG: metal-sensing transcriptional repressor [Candidatus Dojkabacteria bacterium]
MTPETVEQIKNRFKRSEGQLKAVIKMIEEGSGDPKQVMIQLSAVISSLENAKIQLVEEYTKATIIKSISGISDLLK